MKGCIDIKDQKFRDLVKISGLPELYVEAYCYKLGTQDEEGNYVFPKLDEIPNSNSEPYLREQLKTTKNDFAKTKDLLNYTKTTNIQQALIKLNTELHTDLEVDAVKLTDDIVILEINRRPSTESNPDFEQQEVQNNRHSAIILDTFCDKLQKLYGVNIVTTTNAEINNSLELSQLPDAQVAKAFIYNNTIYINTDNATVDSKVHELLHLLFATMRDIDSEEYFKLIEMARKFKNFDHIAQSYPNRTQGDLLEEVFVTELAKHLAGLNSDIQEISEDDYNKIYRQITMMLDSSLEGQISSKSIPQDELYNHSFGKIGQLVNSRVTSYKFLGSLDQTKIHRILANTKSKLMREKRLEEVCGI